MERNFEEFHEGVSYKNYKYGKGSEKCGKRNFRKMLLKQVELRG